MIGDSVPVSPVDCSLCRSRSVEVRLAEPCETRDTAFSLAGVAQLEAQATCNRQVVGSSPTTGSSISAGWACTSSCRQGE